MKAARPSLEVFFRPRTVAVIGASETPESVGRTLLLNLIRSPFGGTLYPVNPKRQSVLGIPAYAKIGDVPAKVDLAVIATPAAGVPDVIGECAAAGVSGAIIISAGFREIGPAGAELERQILERAAGKLRVLGPNCVGVMSPLTGLNATFIGSMARPGNVAFLSQSGALGAAVLDWSYREGVGFSTFVSIGSMLDVGWGDLISYLNDDAHTQSIILYMESVGDARTFLSAAREAALTKPVIVIKPGRTEAAARAAHSHTGALTGRDEVFDAAFRRCGALRVNSISDIFHLSEALSKQPRPRGPRLAIVTNAGGPGVLATDALIAAGGELAAISPEAMTTLNSFLPPHWSHNNPVDIIGDADPERYFKTVEALAADPSNDGLLMILVGQGMTDPSRVADRLKTLGGVPFKPVLASWMGGADVAAGESVLSRAGIATFPHPDAAARVFQSMWRYTDNLRLMYETPAAVAPGVDIEKRTAADQMIQRIRNDGRVLLTEAESKNVLEAYGIPCVETEFAATEDDAVECANRIGYPVVAKLNSQTVTHKSDVGGVQLDLRSEAAVREAWRAIRESVAERTSLEDFQGVTVQQMLPRPGEDTGWEIILGSSIDPQFGPVLLFGAGGKLIHIFKDSALEFPPLNTTLARRMMERTKIYQALQGVRGHKPADLIALEHLLVRFSRMVARNPWIREVDVNPLLVTSERIVALDARVVLHPLDVREEDLPKLAIRPYPSQYITHWTLRSGEPVTIRPIAPEDEPLIVGFHGKLSERSVYFRYFHLLPLDRRTAHERLTRICFLDYDREIALVVERNVEGAREIIAVGRLTKLRGKNEAEFAVLVCDAMQGQGIGKELLRRLVEIGKAEGLDAVTGTILPENRAMVEVCKRLGFKIHTSWEQGDVEARYTIHSGDGTTDKHR